MASSTSRHAWHDPRSIAALWTGLLAGPIVFLTLLEAVYVLSYVACETRQTWFLHLAVLIAAVGVAAAGWLAWTYRPKDDTQAGSAPVTRATAEARARWMALGGVGLSIWFIVVILSMEIPIAILKTCQ